MAGNIKNNEHREFMRLFMRSQRRLYAYVMASVPVPSDADDIVQDIASLLWEKYSEYRAGSDFASWAISIARLKVLRYYRDSRTHHRKFSQTTLEVLEQLCMQDDEDENERVEKLRNCVKKLGDVDRRIISLRYQENATLKKVASQLGFNPNTLYSRLSKIHRMLLCCLRRAMVD
jgi:RNA polymerase sigma-70 factor (ECF subfamily)